MKEKIVILGSGGQGILTAGLILVQAGMFSGKHVTFFPSYGAEMRGGYSTCHVIISDVEIGSPIFYHPSTLIAMDKTRLEIFLKRLENGSRLFLNSSLIKSINQKNIKIINVPATETAEKIGNIKIANMVMLGAYIKETKILEEKYLLKSIESYFKDNSIINKKAFFAGLQLSKS